MENFEQQARKIEELLKKEKITTLKKDFSVLSAEYRAENINSKSVVSQDNDALSYISSRMGETSVVIDSVLKRLEMLTKFSNEVKSVLDVGSGTGSGLWALDNYIKGASVTAVEKEMSMIKYSKLLVKELSCKVEYLQESILSPKCNNLQVHDLVIEGFMLNEMTDKERIKAVDIMSEKTGKFLILVEPGTPKSYERMMGIRDYLLSKNLKLILPCPHNNKCGLQNDYCNFSVRVNRTKMIREIKGATLNYEDEKYFYLVFARNEKIVKPTSIILRRPIYRKGCVDLKLCNKDSSVKQKTFTKSYKENYKSIKKLNHGDYIL